MQHKQLHFHSRRDIQLISVIGYLIGAEIELARLETDNWKLSKQLQAPKSSPPARDRIRWL